jgi:hypothetical protein
MSGKSILSREGFEERLSSNPEALAAYKGAMSKFVNNSVEQSIFHLHAVSQYLNIPFTDAEHKQAEPFLKEYQAAGKWSGINWRKQ